VSEPILLVEDLGPVRRLTMNRPGSLNALNADLVGAMSRALDEASDDDDVRVLILRGAGRAFCAGYDLNEDASGGVLDAPRWQEELTHSTEEMLKFLEHPKPVIASVHSYCLAGGTDLILAGEHTAGAAWHGTLEGAVRSGERAAAQVASILD
jgi:enoyl-CoA hydratase/carnithine racemase